MEAHEAALRQDARGAPSELGSLVFLFVGPEAKGAGIVAKEVAEATGGVVGQLAKSEGYKVTVSATRNIVARIKESGAVRVSIDRLGSLTREGLVSADRALTHLKDLSAEEIVNLIQKAKEIVGVPK
jgi:hypothetical protein